MAAASLVLVLGSDEGVLLWAGWAVLVLVGVLLLLLVVVLVLLPLLQLVLQLPHLLGVVSPQRGFRLVPPLPGSGLTQQGTWGIDR